MGKLRHTLGAELFVRATEPVRASPQRESVVQDYRRGRVSRTDEAESSE